MMTTYALELNNISKVYQDGESEKNVLDNVTIKVKPGEFAAIVGPSGSGKSTMLSIAGALLSSSKGEVIIGDTKLDNNNKNWNRVRREKIGFIFQSHQLVPYLTVKDQLNLIAKITKNKDKKEFETYADELLKDLGLEDSKTKYPNKLFGWGKTTCCNCKSVYE